MAKEARRRVPDTEHLMEEVRIGKEAKGAVTRSHKSQTMRRWQFILKERLGERWLLK